MIDKAKAIRDITAALAQAMQGLVDVGATEAYLLVRTADGVLHAVSAATTNVETQARVKRRSSHLSKTLIALDQIEAAGMQINEGSFRIVPIAIEPKAASTNTKLSN